jgi:hypothetical protein
MVASLVLALGAATAAAGTLHAQHAAPAGYRPA